MSIDSKLALISKFLDNCSTLVFTMSIYVDKFSEEGKTIILNLRFKAEDISLTLLSLVLAVAIIEKPFCASNSLDNSGIEILFSDNIDIKES